MIAPALCDTGTIEAVPAHWIMEPKLDGWRWQAVIEADGVVCVGGRNGKTWPCPPVQASLTALPAGTILDGELIPAEPGHQSTRVPSLLARGGYGLTYVIFDVLRLAGHPTTHLKWRERRELLERLQPHLDLPASVVPYAPVSRPLVEEWLAAGLEGAVCKDPEAPYAVGRRTRGWVKIKPQTTADATVIGFDPGKGKYAGMVGALRLRMTDTGVETTASGMNDATRLDMTARPDHWLGARVEIAHHGLHPVSRVPRHPQFRRLRDDLMAA